MMNFLSNKLHKEKDSLINKEISHRKKRIHKQASFISNENLQSTIDNEYKKTRDKDNINIHNGPFLVRNKRRILLRTR